MWKIKLIYSTKNNSSNYNTAIIQCNGQYRVQKKKAFIYLFFWLNHSTSAKNLLSLEKFAFKYCEKWTSLQPGMIYARGKRFKVAFQLGKPSKSFRVVIQPLSTRLFKPNFCFDLSHRRSTTVFLETRNLFVTSIN